MRLARRAAPIGRQIAAAALREGGTMRKQGLATRPEGGGERAANL
jgi:hypothetical protein